MGEKWGFWARWEACRVVVAPPKSPDAVGKCSCSQELRPRLFSAPSLPGQTDGQMHPFISLHIGVRGVLLLLYIYYYLCIYYIFSFSLLRAWGLGGRQGMSVRPSVRRSNSSLLSVLCCAVWRGGLRLLEWWRGNAARWSGAAVLCRRELADARGAWRAAVGSLLKGRACVEGRLSGAAARCQSDSCEY